MVIQFNGQQLQTQAKNLDAFLNERNIDKTTVATAVNGEFVPRSQYPQFKLTHGCSLEVLAPMQGG